LDFSALARDSTSTKWTTASCSACAISVWIEGHTVAIDFRWAEGHSERLVRHCEFRPLKSMSLLRRQPSVVAAKRRAVIPIVFPAAGDPVGSGLRRLARPGSNVSGLNTAVPRYAANASNLLREIAPDLAGGSYGECWQWRRCAEMSEVEIAARTVSVEVFPLEIRHAEDMRPLPGIRGHAEWLYVISDRW